MEIFRLIFYLLFLILVGVGMVYDIRYRVFPGRLGYALFLTALVYLVVAGQWGAVALLFIVVAGYRLRNTGWILLISFASIAIYYRNDALALMYTMALAFFFLFLMGWIQACDAEIVFPLIALTGDKPMLNYLVAGWIIVPPVIVFFQRGIRGGIHRFAYVAKALVTRTAAPLEDPEALRWPWAVTSFAILILYYFVYPGIIISWIRSILA